MRAAAVVAHPDDESLWFGGLVAAEPGDWTIICCSIPRSDPIRAWKFFDACTVLGAKPRLLPFAERQGSDLDGLDAINLDGFDRIVTHNHVGEYGHPHHVSLHKWLRARYRDVLLTGCYGKSAGPLVVKLDARQLGIKMAAIRSYDHVSPHDSGRPKWQALLDRYGTEFDLSCETYERHRP